MKKFVGILKKGVFMKRIFKRIVIEEEERYLYKKKIYFMIKILGV